MYYYKGHASVRTSGRIRASGRPQMLLRLMRPAPRLVFGNTRLLLPRLHEKACEWARQLHERERAQRTYPCVD
jgi:hypothetical protein